MSGAWKDVEKPDGIAELEVDHRGYPVFYSVFRHGDGKPDFRVIDQDKRMKCAQKKLCGICGKPLGYYMIFIGGPVAARNRAFGDSPMHRECAEYAMKVCPYLTIESMQYEKDHERKYQDQQFTTDPNVIMEKPEKMCLFITRGYRIEPNGSTWVYIAKPAVEIEWRGMDGKPLLLGEEI